MIAGRLKYFRFHFRGRGASWLALVGQLIALVGLPLPPASAKDRSQPFPCQHRMCGCMTASDCWTSCCCFTASQRLAWAQEHDVETPSSLVEQAEQEGDCPTSELKPCCKKKQTSEPNPEKRSTREASGWLLRIQARSCGGAASEEGQGVPMANTVVPLVWRYEWALIALLAVVSHFAEQVPHLPPAPPPRG